MKLVNTGKQYSTIDTSVEELAAQFTIIDLPIFKSIKRDELTNMATGSSSLKKRDLAPNLVAMNRQFNQVTFWVVGQILYQNTPRLRAELISHFIKTAKQLHNLNNLHSSYAVVSALLSTPIYRLEKTWNYVRRKYPKEKQQFDQLRELFSDNNNYELLRNHLDVCSLPCIPYLGVYSRDIIYINEAHQEGTIQRAKSTSKILESIEKFQQSHYEHLTQVPRIYQCLITSRYLDELQKFVEDENYRRSLELEPSEYNNTSTSSGNNNNNNTVTSRHKKSAMLLASLTSMVQAAVLTTSNKFGGASPRRSSSESQKINNRYLIDDSFIDHANLAPPISTRS